MEKKSGFELALLIIGIILFSGCTQKEAIDNSSMRVDVTTPTLTPNKDNKTTIVGIFSEPNEWIQPPDLPD